MAKIKEIFLSIKQSFSQILRAVMGRDAANDSAGPSTQQNRYYS